MILMLGTGDTSILISKDDRDCVLVFGVLIMAAELKDCGNSFQRHVPAVHATLQCNIYSLYIY